MTTPITKYASSGSIKLAYQQIGDVGDYLILIPGWVTNIEESWNIPQLSAWLTYLASFTRLVIFDKRGTGLSDNVSQQNLPNIEQRAEDLKIIMKSIGIEKANFMGLSEGGPLSIYLAASFPEMVNRLILVGSFPKWIKTSDYPYGKTRAQHDKIKAYIFKHWGEPIGLNLMAPSIKDNTIAQEQWARFLRRSASPSNAKVLYEMNIEIDVRNYLKDVVAPTLIMHRLEDALIEFGHSKYLHEHIADSQLITSNGKDHLPWFSVKRKEVITIQTFLKDGKAIDNPKLDFLTIEDIFILYDIKDYVQNHFHEDLKIKDLARLFGLNEYKVKRGFKLLFDTPVISYLTDIRLDKASKLLMGPKETIESIAEQVGYEHANNFSVAFKRKFGLSPSKYRSDITNI
ncbi:alpha/beta fold hydrolase [Winogradskyella sp. 3972H.M.0a.05]|uniref:alpha/beta fold hydrolase n=1 Tax=Winogradskyella sp. 3972H.M.0a.05 TaxID=2950277 RepID=UPI00339609E5